MNKTPYKPSKNTAEQSRSFSDPGQSSADGYNRQSVLEFIGWHIFWLYMSMKLYKPLLFRSLEHCSLRASNWILWAIVIAFVSIGIGIEIRNYRRSMNVFFNLITGYGIYTAIAYLPIRPQFIKIVLLFVAGLLIVFLIPLFVIRRRNTKRCHNKLRLNLPAVFVVLHKFVALGLSIIIITLITELTFDSSLLRPSVHATMEKYVSEHTIANNMDTLSVLADERWTSLSPLEKLNVLQTVANVEQSYLGLPHELNVCMADNETTDDDLYVDKGHYVDLTHEITISTEHLLYSSSWKLVETVCHEAYHSYQYRLIDAMDSLDETSKNLKMFRIINLYSEEFGQYENGDQDFEAYYSQRCESDARDYAEEAVWDYRRKIEESRGFDFPQYLD